MKNVLIIGPYPPSPGGVSQVVFNISENLPNKYRMIVLSPKQSGFDYIDLTSKKKAIIFYNIPYQKKYRNPQIMLFTTINYLMKCKNIDLIHIHDHFYLGPGVLSSKIPVVLTMHGCHSIETASRGRISEGSLQFKFVRSVEKRSTRRADHITVVSDHIKDWAISTLETEPRKVQQVNNGVDLKRFSRMDPNKELIKEYDTDGKVVLLFMKALIEQNGILLLLKSMKQIVKKNKNVVLLVCGEGPLMGRAQKYIVQNGLVDHVKICGQVSMDEVPSYYAMADIVILPSIDKEGAIEGMSITMLEGMACGKVVLASDIGGNKQVIGSQKRSIGVLFKENDDKDLADKLSKLIRSEQTRQEIGRSALSYVKKNHTWKGIAKEYDRIYIETIKKRSQ